MNPEPLVSVENLVKEFRVARRGEGLKGAIQYLYAVRTLYSFHTETAISRSIRDGSVTLELIRPLNYQAAPPIHYAQMLAGYELTFCLRPVHALAGPVLGGILSGKQLMVGSANLEERLASAEAVLKRIERGLRRLGGR